MELKGTSVKNGKIIYAGNDKRTKSVVAEINDLGGFPILGGGNKKNLLYEERKILKPTPDNLWLLRNYI